MYTNIKKELLRFISEDIQSGDITSVLLPKKKIKAKIISREEGILAGVRFAREIFHLKGCRGRIMKKDGTRLKPNQVVLEVSGNARTVLSCERTALNLLSRMSGIATHTSFLVSKIKKINKKTKRELSFPQAKGENFQNKTLKGVCQFLIPPMVQFLCFFLFYFCFFKNLSPLSFSHRPVS